MRTKRFGFTVVELLTVVAIIAMLVALLIPSLSMVRNFAKETRQKAQFAAIGQALTAFRNDYGDYPLSEARDIANLPYCGAQKLAEALLGQDLLGFYPGSYWAVDRSGVDRLGNLIDCYPPNPPDDNLRARRGPYLELTTVNAFTPGQLFYPAAPIGLTLRKYVLCDSFPVKKVTLGNKTVTAGTPILYYRAHTDRMDWVYTSPQTSRYDYRDNQALCSAPSLINRNLLNPSVWHPFEFGFLPGDPQDPGVVFYWDRYKILDLQASQASTRLWPHRPDSYILISAGADGLYGTPDDITNFEN